MLQWIRSITFIVGCTVFMPVIGLLYAPWALFSKRGAYACCKCYSRGVMWMAEHIVGMRCEVRGTPPTDAVLIAAKHQSFLDILMIFQSVPAGKFIMKREILWMPVIGQYAKRMGMIPVNRGKRGQAVTKMLADVRVGDMEAGQMIIYAQGTRVAPGAVVPYKKGTAALYEQLGQPCVPVATNVGYFWPRRGLYRRPGVAVVEFLEPMPAGMARKEFMETLERVVETRSDQLLADARAHSKR
ncbi:lysophospholipid acyltransferase family protein [Roseobacter sp. GAI101]|uniref:lysophospholipid acyltransferase family protein n=1 Tax=Roseobacter sp. (strain GAI101) TaxID=391589 RepID=UPI00018726DE|nr:lysophospholipid acyltransferase family protein [Roseobacter sp. GAI101]EEB85267.1 acyltransferase family protein [Roseobacter sp. GAI101]